MQPAHGAVQPRMLRPSALQPPLYRIMEASSAAACVRQLYPEDLSLARDKLATFLSGWLGGPRLYAERFGPISIPQFHTRWNITQTEREAWLACMRHAIARQPYSVEFADYLLAQLRMPAERAYQASQRARGCPIL
ncbi:Group 2 truncated hemoglobin GlbO [compost metagenome]